MHRAVAYTFLAYIPFCGSCYKGLSFFLLFNTCRYCHRKWKSILLISFQMYSRFRCLSPFVYVLLSFTCAPQLPLYAAIMFQNYNVAQIAIKTTHCPVIHHLTTFRLLLLLFQPQKVSILLLGLKWLTNGGFLSHLLLSFPAVLRNIANSVYFKTFLSFTCDCCYIAK